MTETSIHPTAKVARDLSAILDLHARLASQAEHQASHSLMPGGHAMVALGNVANLEAWENLQGATERYARAYTSAEDEDPDEAWSPFQLLEFWSEGWRREHGAEYDARPTIASEANFIRWALDWAWQNEPAWDEFAADVARARTRLENILTEGVRAERGVPCLYDECKGARLVRKMQPGRDAEGRKVWVHSNWHCPKCHREWDESRYAAMVTAGTEAAKSETIDGEEWVTTDLAARRVGRPAATIRQWVHKGKLEVLCIVRGRRIGFVRMAEVWERHDNSKRRSGAA
ncbi:hypothetical protein J2X46_002714 [Nocardioides sp. BE266]|uniref:hypothetical protein n=1 Tax=Nocardioides sp. BE266 TaxID=2817725 RepID=UPI0028674CB6|nr:hypothetical protein [Nocardioides sp. BE266]MDR7253724.1 hypothetical protein [Nocardioides sp. BE266]